MPANSPTSVSVLDDPRSPVSYIDYDLCVREVAPFSPNSTQLNHDDDFNLQSHIMFTRDVAPYQRSQYQRDDYYQDAESPWSKKKDFTIRIQGVKTDSNNKCGSSLPIIKVRFAHKNICVKYRLSITCLPSFVVTINDFAKTSTGACGCCRFRRTQR